MNPKVKKLYCLLALVPLLSLLVPPLHAQKNYGVQASVTITQPTIYLPDYYTPGSNTLQISLRILDLTKPVYAVRLSLKIEGLGNGIVLETIPGSIAAPITLAPYGTTLLTGSDLEPYFNPSNLSIRGMSRDLYNRTRTLPSGTYTFNVTAYDYQRPDRVPVSNTAFTLSRLQLAYPPEPLVPANKGLVSTGFISFMWTAPSGLGMLTTPPDYRLELYELLDPSRKPEDETASAQPLIVRNVPMATTYPYNVMMESPQLIPGHRYAWRVQAVFADGRQVVDKNGYSRLNTFVYNSGAGALSRLTGFKAKAESQRIISASWNIPSGAELPDGYHLEFRKTGNNSYEWFPEETTEPRVTIHNLEPSTEYELRVQTTSAGYRGDYSDGVKVTTPPPKVYTCDDSENTDTIITNFTPLMSLLPGEYFSNDPGFEFRVLRVTKSVGGVFDGACCVTIPWLGGTFACNFYGIKLNTDFRMLDGEVEILEDDLEEWIAKEKNNPTDLLSAAADALVSGYGVGHVITGDAATAVTTTWEGTPTVTKTGGEFTVNGSPVSLASTTGGFTVADASGKLYVVDEKGKNVTEVGKTAAGTTMKTYNERASSWNKLDASTKVTFTNNNDDLWKFDEYNQAYSASVVFTSKYEDLNGYRVPWKLIPEGKWGKVIAQLTGKVADPDRVIFRTPKGTEYKASRSGNTYELTLVSGKAGDAQEVYALYPTSDTSFTSLGKLQVATYAMQQRKFSLVPMVTKDVPKADAITSVLTDIYRPYGIEWQVKVEEAFTDMSWDADHNNLLEADGAGLFSVYTSEMKALIKAYRTNGRTVDPATSYIFIVPGFNNSQSTLLGDMPLSQQFGFVTTGSTKPLAHTIAHELGHGAFQLYHTFGKYNIPQASTSNLMDYKTDGGELVKYQWDAMNDPGLHVGWLDKEGEVKYAVALNEGIGIAPNGQIILKYNKKYPVAIIRENPDDKYTIKSFKAIISGTQSILYTWDGGKYVPDANILGAESFGNDDFALLATDKESKVTYISKIISGGCVAFSQKITWINKDDVGKLDAIAKKGVWVMEWQHEASDDCMNQFYDAVKNHDSNQECTDEQVIKAYVTQITEAVAKNQNATILVNYTNITCLSSLRLLDPSIQNSLFSSIAQQTSFVKGSELALLRLMSSIRKENYADFFALLEKENSKLISILIDKLNDKFIFWGENDFTNFNKALVIMLAKSPDYYQSKFVDYEDEKIFAQILNLDGKDFNDDITAPDLNALDVLFGDRAITSYRYSGAFVPNTGMVQITRELEHRNNLTPIYEKDDLFTPINLSPLTPVIITSVGGLDLVKYAIDGTEIASNTYIVPAIFLNYKRNKELNDAFIKAGLTSLDVITIASSGGTALATKVYWVKRIWALTEVAGAFTNVGITNGVISNKSVIAANSAFSLGMGIIGIKNATVGLSGVVKSLTVSTKDLIKNNQSLKAIVLSSYLNWTAALKEAGDITSTERKLVEEQYGVYSSLGVTPKTNEGKIIAWEKAVKIAGGTDDLIASLSGTLKSTFDDLISAGLRSEIKANSILLKNTQNETVAIIYNNKITPTKWKGNYKAAQEGYVKTVTDEGYWILKKGDDIKIDLGFKEGRTIEAKEVNDYLVNGQGKDLDGQPYWAGTQVDELILGKNEEIIYFIEDYNEGNPNPGQYASKDAITSIKELRKKLAVKEAWKKTENEPTLRAYRVKVPLKSRSGIIGPQLDKGIILPGGGHQYEIIDFLGPNWSNYLTPLNEKFEKGIKLK